MCKFVICRQLHVLTHEWLITPQTLRDEYRALPRKNKKVSEFTWKNERARSSLELIGRKEEAETDRDISSSLYDWSEKHKSKIWCHAIARMNRVLSALSFHLVCGHASPTVLCWNTGFKMRNKKYRSRIHPYNGIISYYSASHVYRLFLPPLSSPSHSHSHASQHNTPHSLSRCLFSLRALYLGLNLGLLWASCDIQHLGLPFSLKRQFSSISDL